MIAVDFVVSNGVCFVPVVILSVIPGIRHVCRVKNGFKAIGLASQNSKPDVIFPKSFTKPQYLNLWPSHEPIVTLFVGAMCRVYCCCADSIPLVPLLHCLEENSGPDCRV